MNTGLSLSDAPFLSRLFRESLVPVQVLRHPDRRPPLRVVLQAVVGVADGLGGAQRGGDAVPEDAAVGIGGGEGREGRGRGGGGGAESCGRRQRSC